VSCVQTFQSLASTSWAASWRRKGRKRRNGAFAFYFQSIGATDLARFRMREKKAYGAAYREVLVLRLRRRRKEGGAICRSVVRRRRIVSSAKKEGKEVIRSNNRSIRDGPRAGRQALFPRRIGVLPPFRERREEEGEEGKGFPRLDLNGTSRPEAP